MICSLPKNLIEPYLLTSKKSQHTPNLKKSIRHMSKPQNISDEQNQQLPILHNNKMGYTKGLMSDKG